MMSQAARHWLGFKILPFRYSSKWSLNIRCTIPTIISYINVRFYFRLALFDKLQNTLFAKLGNHLILHFRALQLFLKIPGECFRKLIGTRSFVLSSQLLKSFSFSHFFKLIPAARQHSFNVRYHPPAVDLAANFARSILLESTPKSGRACGSGE